jgi:hypothetical protein
MQRSKPSEKSSEKPSRLRDFHFTMQHTLADTPFWTLKSVTIAPGDEANDEDVGAQIVAIYAAARPRGKWTVRVQADPFPDGTDIWRWGLCSPEPHEMTSGIAPTADMALRDARRAVVDSEQADAKDYRFE